MVQKTKVAQHKPKGYHKNTHTGVIVAVIFILVALTTAGILVFINRDKIFNNTSTNETQEEPDKKQQKNDNSQDKTEANKQIPETREEEKPSVAPYDGKDPNTLSEITGVISFAGISEGDFIVTAALDQALGASGSCKFTITHGADPAIISSVSTSAGPTTSFCTYSIPATSISSGHYNINIEISTDSKKGIINGEVDI